MNFEYADRNHKTVEVDESPRVILQDKDGDRYRVTADKFGGRQADRGTPYGECDNCQNNRPTMEKVLIFRIDSEPDRSSAETTVNDYLNDGWTVQDTRINNGLTVFILEDTCVPEQESDEDDDDGWW